jgi:hypothetical protein
MLAPIREVASAQYPLDQPIIRSQPEAGAATERCHRFGCASERARDDSLNPEWQQEIGQRARLTLPLAREWAVAS